MSPTAPHYAGTATSASGSYAAWTNTSYATGPSSSNFTTANATSLGNSNLLQLTNYGFNIPSTAVIDGIVVFFNRYADNAASFTSAHNLIHSGSSISGGFPVPPNDVLDGWPFSYPTSSGASDVIYGGAATLWGATLTPAIINSSSFGVEIQANGTANYYINGVGIVVYWHTAPTTIPRQKYYLYKVYDSVTGNYLGNLPAVSTDFAFSQDINTAAAQINVSCGISADTSAQPNDILTDESGNVLTDESSNTLTDEGSFPYSGVGTSSALIRNGNEVKVWEYGHYYPNGKLLFSGVMERGTDNFGGDTGDDDIQLIIYSDGTDASDYMILNQQTVDQSQTSSDGVLPISFETNYPWCGQTITPGPGVNGVARITLNIAALTPNTNPVVILSLFAAGTGGQNFSRYATGQSWGNTPDAIASQIITSTTAQNYDFVLGYTFPSTFSGYYVIALSCTSANGVNITYDSSNVYSSGTIVLPGATVMGDVWFLTYSNSTSTDPLFSSVDPSNMLLSVVNGYGGKIAATNSSVQETGLSINYQFNTNYVNDCLTAMPTLSPFGFYYYVDLGTDILYFQQASTTADFVLIKGVHINKLQIVRTIEYVINTVYVVGGTDPNTNLPIYTFDSDATSKQLYRQRAQTHTDNNIIDIPTSHIVGQSIVQENKSEQYQTVVSIVSTTMDITLLTPGKIIGFSGFGTYVDTLLAQVVHRDYTPDSVTLTLGILPHRETIKTEQVAKGLVALSTVDNVSTPS